jgi:hypothetical protein
VGRAAVQLNLIHRQQQQQQQNSPFFEPEPPSEDCARLHQIFHFFRFRNSNFFTEQGHQPCV